MFRLRTDELGANPTHATTFQVQPPTAPMAMGMTPMGMQMGMYPEPMQPPQAPLRPLKFIGMSGDGQPVYQHRSNPAPTNPRLARTPTQSVP